MKDSVVRTVGTTTFFDPSLSRFESIIASGRLGLIRDNDLRAAIADWPNTARYPQYPANSRREMFRNQFIPFLIAGYDVQDWLGPGDRPTGALIELPVDATFINMLQARAWMDAVVLGTERSVASQLEDFVSRLEAAGAR